MKRDKDIIALTELLKMAATMAPFRSRNLTKRSVPPRSVMLEMWPASLPARWRRRPRLSVRRNKTLETGSRRCELGVVAGVQDEYV